MKSLQTYMLAAAGCLALASCSSDDNGGTNNNVSSDLVGTYKLSTMTAATAQDYDNDGDSSTNLALEGSCANTSFISFHDDGTYDQSITRSTSGNAGTSLDCQTSVSSGTYTRNGNNVITQQTSGSAAVTTTYTFDSSSKTLSGTANNMSYAGWNTATNLWADVTSNVQVAFTKYTDNDDDNGANIDAQDNLNASAAIFSKFNLTSYIVGQAQDYNNDGQSSTNLASEGNCYSSSYIQFKTDGTYEEHFTKSVLSNNGLSLECQTTTTTGHYTRVGDTVIKRNSTGTGSLALNLNSTTNVLTGTQNEQSYSGWNILTNLWATLTGNVQLGYTRSNS